MDKLLLSLMAASGLWTVYSLPGRQFHFVYEKKTMAEAQSYCREKYTDLASISSSEEMDLLINMAASNNELMWIGLIYDINNWIWSLQDRSFYSDGESKFRNWEPGQPDNGNSNQKCTEMYHDGLWNDKECTTSSQTVCSEVTGSNVTFVLNPTRMTWSDAQSYCRENHTDLASVRNMKENNLIRSLVPVGGPVWIGLYREPWKWTDGSTSSFRFWQPGQPDNSYGNEYCVAANFGNSGRWEDLPCDQKRAFICYSSSVSRVFKVRLTKSSSSLDLNDPAVLENILKQLKQKLKDQGVEEDLKLSWRTQSDGQVFHKEKKKKEQKKRRKRWITKREEL